MMLSKKENTVDGIHIDTLPTLRHPMMIMGFGGWGNALEISTEMAEYLIRKFDASLFATLDSDLFYRYDSTRPVVNIQAGSLKSLRWPGGEFYSAPTKSEKGDLLVLRAEEPTLRWHRFGEEFFNLCRQLNVKTIISIGSMYDHVLHSDRIISGMASSDALSTQLQAADVMPIYYQGPSAIHSLFQKEGPKQGFDCVSLWCHCPFYLDNTIHFGLLSDLAQVLASLGGFDLDTTDLEDQWNGLRIQIQRLIEENPRVAEVIEELKENQDADSLAKKKEAARDEKVIRLRDFLD